MIESIKVKKIVIKDRNIKKLKNKKVVLFGASNYGKDFYMGELKRNNIDIIAFSDNDKNKWGKLFYGVNVVSPKQLNELNFDIIIITSMYFKEISNQLIMLNIDIKKIATVKLPITTNIKNSETFNKCLAVFYKLNSCIQLNGITKKIRPEGEIIISLTTIPSRIDKVWLAIESLLRQYYKPNRIILWLAEEEFKDRKLPLNLIKQQKRGLEIKYCENLKSHKKYYYALKENPEAIIITVDDDILYPKTLIKELIDVHKQHPKLAVCNRAHRILFDENKNIKNYGDWDLLSPNFRGPSHSLLQIGCLGVLYPPHSLNSEVLNKEKFMRLCPTTDDLWLKVMLVLNNTKVVKVGVNSQNFIEINGTQEIALWKYNIYESGNDNQLKTLFNEFSLNYNYFTE